MAYNVELRERVGGLFGNVIRVASDVTIVDGLLDGNGKINLGLFPSSMLSSKKNAGPILGTKTFAGLYTDLQTFNGNQSELYAGTFFIANGKVIINPSTGHVVLYGDDGQGVSQVAIELEHGDHLFYVKYGSEYLWNDLSTVLNIVESYGVANLSAPYNTILGSHIFATEDELNSNIPTVNNLYALITGYRWVQTTQTDYNNAGYQVNKSANIGGNPTYADANKACIPSYNLWDHGQMDIVLRLDDIGLGYSYWRMEEAIPLHQTNPQAYQSIAFNDKHFWGVINNDYPIATQGNAGLMSASDKFKLDNMISNVAHYGDVSGSTQLTIGANKVTYSKMQKTTIGRLLGRVTEDGVNTTGQIEELTPSQIRTLINVEDNANNYSHPNHTGDVTSSGDGATTIANKAVTLAKIQDIATARILGRKTTGNGVTEQLTKTDVLTFLNVADGANKTEFADEDDVEAGTDTALAINSVMLKHGVDFFGGMKRYANNYATDGAVANAGHSDGAIVMFTLSVS